jgi:hypothetical protein
MGVATMSVIADRDPDTRAAVRSAALERFTRLIAAADSATRTLAAWCGQPPTTRIHTREEAATLPEEAVLLGLPPTTTVQRRQITHRRPDGTVLCERRPGPSGAGGVGRAGGRGRAGGPGQGDLSRARAVVTAPALPVESQCLEIGL